MRVVRVTLSFILVPTELMAISPLYVEVLAQAAEMDSLEAELEGGG